MQRTRDNSGFSQQALQELRFQQSISDNMTNQCLVLRYCRVAQLIHDPLHLAVEPYVFESQMQYLAENCNVISLTELKQHLEASKPFNKRTTAVTFDIGYSELLYTVKPVLEKYRIPATVFAVSAGMSGLEQLWFDYLEDYLLAASLPDEINIELDNRESCFALRNQYERFCAYEKLEHYLRKQPAEQQSRVLEQLKSVARIDDSELDSHCLLDNQELPAIANSEFISIGGSTHNCIDLQYLDTAEQQQEICKNKSILEQLIDTPLDFFAQPFNSCAGQGCNKTQDLIRQAGYGMVMGNSYGSVNIDEHNNCGELARVKSGNWNGFTFHQFLERFFN